MAEGGYDFDNPTFDKDDYDDDDNLNDLTPDGEFQRTILNQSTHIDTLVGNDKEQALYAQQKLLVKEFYKEIQERYGFDPSFTPKHDNFKLDADGKTLYWVIHDKEIRISAKQGEAAFLSLGSLANEYNRTFGKGGAIAIRQYLNLPEYRSQSRPMPNQVKDVLESTRNDLSTVDIPQHDISNVVELNDLTNTVGDVETAVKSLETSFIDNWEVEERVDGQTQTTIDKREMDGIIKAMTTVSEELTNELAKLTATNKEIAKEKEKLEQAYGDEYQTKKIESRISDLESERSARLEVININKEKLRSQVSRIKSTIHKILTEDTTIGEKLRTLFREQGITIVSVLTAVGMIIGLIVETVIPSGAGSSTTPPSKPTGVKEWIKKQLSYIGKLLANLAGKAAAALPGIIGSIVSWLLSTTSKVVNWFGEHLWALAVLIAGLLYASAKEYINKS